MSILQIEKDYPFRKSLIKIARCGMCEYFYRDEHWNNISCKKGLKVKGSFMNNEHDCSFYKFKPDIIPMPKNGFIFIFNGLLKKRKECSVCIHLLQERCDGIKWFPFDIIKNKCEFFRPKEMICKHAIPYLQYENHHRNNYCSLSPELRDQAHDCSKSWEWNCSDAHIKNVTYKKCYQKKGED